MLLSKIHYNKFSLLWIPVYAGMTIFGLYSSCYKRLHCRDISRPSNHSFNPHSYNSIYTKTRLTQTIQHTICQRACKIKVRKLPNDSRSLCKTHLQQQSGKRLPPLPHPANSAISRPRRSTASTTSGLQNTSPWAEKRDAIKFLNFRQKKSFSLSNLVTKTDR